MPMRGSCCTFFRHIIVKYVEFGGFRQIYRQPTRRQLCLYVGQCEVETSASAIAMRRARGLSRRELMMLRSRHLLARLIA